MPHQRLRVQLLPVHPLFALHETNHPRTSNTLSANTPTRTRLIQWSPNADPPYSVVSWQRSPGGMLTGEHLTPKPVCAEAWPI
jgi:hypothetical protein